MGIKVAVAVLGGIWALFFSAQAMAITTGQLFETPPGATVGGQPVSAMAIITLAPDVDRIAVQLFNNQVNPTSVIQNLSDFGFSLSTGQTAGSMVSSLGTLVEIRADGSYTPAGSMETGWELQEGYDFVSLENGIVVGALGTGLRIHVLGTEAGPANTLIGLPSGNTDSYGNANGSIAGNQAHNPFIFYQASFYLQVPGIDDSTRIAGVLFSFGTQDTPAGIPEPRTLIFLGIGLAALAGAAKRWDFTRGKGEVENGGV